MSKQGDNSERRSPRKHSGSKRKHQEDNDKIGGGEGDNINRNINEQILDVLRSIDARLGRIERQGLQLGGGRHGQAVTRRRDASSNSFTQTTTVNGSWKLMKSNSFDSTMKGLSTYIRARLGRSSQVPTSAFGKIDEEGLVLTGEPYLCVHSTDHPARKQSGYGQAVENVALWANDLLSLYSMTRQNSCTNQESFHWLSSTMVRQEFIIKMQQLLLERWNFTAKDT